MTAIGIERFERILEKLLEKSRDGAVEWTFDQVEKCYRVHFQQQAQVSLYQHAPPRESKVAGAVLHVRDELVITLEAEQGEDEWPLLSELYLAAQRSADTGDREIEAIEQELESQQHIGGHLSESQRSRPPRESAPRAFQGTQFPGWSLEDLEDGDTPLNEEL